jgi:hypothetical protein
MKADIIALCPGLTHPPVHESMYMSGNANGSGMVSSDFETREIYVSDTQHGNQIHWVSSLNNTSLVMGNGSYAIYKNGTIERVGR